MEANKGTIESFVVGAVLRWQSCLLQQVEMLVVGSGPASDAGKQSEVLTSDDSDWIRDQVRRNFSWMSGCLLERFTVWHTV